jgi:hypothetical protein
VRGGAQAMLKVQKKEREHLNIYIKGHDIEIIERLKYHLDREYKKLSVFLIEAARDYLREQELKEQEFQRMLDKKLKDQKESQFSDPDQEVVWCEWCDRYIEPVIIKDEVYCPYCKLVL